MDFQTPNLKDSYEYNSQRSFRRIVWDHRGRRAVQPYKLNNLSPGWVNLTDFILNEKRDIFRASVNSINQRITSGITQVQNKDKKEKDKADTTSSDSSSISFRLNSLKRRNSIKKK